MKPTITDLNPSRVGPNQSWPGPIVLEAAASGAWVVHDDHALNGGAFRDRETAVKFIRREFGDDAGFVVRMLSDPNRIR